ncbi:MAG: tyrosine-type recombinase/integrase, partial [Ignavibacterium sp.]|uniref:tyrosine-type recombinase/integrase n=1 Tax=Ignavibacterium sp. TaxID=2651167 RepID=UPI003297AE82
DRIVMLSEKLLELLREYVKQYKPKVYLFEGQNGWKYSVRSIQQIFNSAVKKVKIRKKVSVHTLRHSFASHLLDNGTDIRFIQELLGHKHLSTTQIYTHINPASVKKIKSPFDNF